MKKLKIPAIMDNLDSMIEFIIEELNEAALDKKFKSQIHLACEEALVNVINYAYPDRTGNVEISVEVQKDEGTLFISFADEGTEFNPLQKAAPDLGLPMEERSIGGLGVYMYKTIMDEVSYERKEGKNILTFLKKLADAAE